MKRLILPVLISLLALPSSSISQNIPDGPYSPNKLEINVRVVDDKGNFPQGKNFTLSIHLFTIVDEPLIPEEDLQNYASTYDDVESNEFPQDDIHPVPNNVANGRLQYIGERQITREISQFNINLEDAERFISKTRVSLFLDYEGNVDGSMSFDSINVTDEGNTFQVNHSYTILDEPAENPNEL